LGLLQKYLAIYPLADDSLQSNERNVSSLGGKIFFLPIGIALLVVGMGIWRQSHKIKENEQDNSSEINQ